MKMTTTEQAHLHGFAVLASGSRFEPPQAAPRRPLQGPGPWTLAEVSDAVGVAYDAVYRDVQRNLLPALRVRRNEGPVRYLVSIVNLRQSARPCYRDLLRMATPLWRAGAPSLSTAKARNARSEPGRQPDPLGPVAVVPPRRLKGVFGMALEILTEDLSASVRE